MDDVLLKGLVLGLASSLHCVGMCGPIAMAIPVNRTNSFTILLGVLQYNFGRILTYAWLGFIIGSVGITIETFGFLQWVSIIAGIFMILYAWRKWLSVHISFGSPKLGIEGFVSKNLGKVISSNIPFKLSLLGMLNGLLPCGMVYIGLTNALVAGSPLKSVYAMAAFGVGTLATMILVGFAANKISMQLRNKLAKVVPYMLTLVGVLIILRGLNLDIPYISPKMEEVHLNNQKVDVVMKCCYDPIIEHQNNKK
jgi:sulfite exporter TauE/SafE